MITDYIILFPVYLVNHYFLFIIGADMSCFQGLFFCPEAASLLLHNFCVYHISPPGHEVCELVKLSAFDFYCFYLLIISFLKELCIFIVERYYSHNVSLVGLP